MSDYNSRVVELIAAGVPLDCAVLQAHRELQLIVDANKAVAFANMGQLTESIALSVNGKRLDIKSVRQCSNRLFINCNADAQVNVADAMRNERCARISFLHDGQREYRDGKISAWTRTSSVTAGDELLIEVVIAGFPREKLAPKGVDTGYEKDATEPSKADHVVSLPNAVDQSALLAWLNSRRIGAQRIAHTNDRMTIGGCFDDVRLMVIDAMQAHTRVTIALLEGGRFCEWSAKVGCYSSHQAADSRLENFTFDLVDIALLRVLE